jgi:predicted Zn-ribbon and HTH transcriptional regulator
VNPCPNRLKLERKEALEMEAIEEFVHDIQKKSTCYHICFLFSPRPLNNSKTVFQSSCGHKIDAIPTPCQQCGWTFGRMKTGGTVPKMTQHLQLLMKHLQSTGPWLYLLIKRTEVAIYLK